MLHVHEYEWEAGIQTAGYAKWTTYKIQNILYKIISLLAELCTSTSFFTKCWSPFFTLEDWKLSVKERDQTSDFHFLGTVKLITMFYDVDLKCVFLNRKNKKKKLKNRCQFWWGTYMLYFLCVFPSHQWLFLEEVPFVRVQEWVQSIHVKGKVCPTTQSCAF